jgi:hypothetical protein
MTMMASNGSEQDGAQVYTTLVYAASAACTKAVHRYARALSVHTDLTVEVGTADGDEEVAFLDGPGGDQLAIRWTGPPRAEPAHGISYEEDGIDAGTLRVVRHYERTVLLLARADELSRRYLATRVVRGNRKRRTGGRTRGRVPANHPERKGGE